MKPTGLVKSTDGYGTSDECVISNTSARDRCVELVDGAAELNPDSIGVRKAKLSSGLWLNNLRL